MQVIEAQCSRVLAPHDHLHINHDRVSRAALIIRIYVGQGWRCHTPLAAQSGGSARGFSPLEAQCQELLR
jgi:hypothetical protein